jgi:ketosteroid isomerase-like protein
MEKKQSKLRMITLSKIDFYGAQQLINGYFNALDRRDYDAVLDLLTDDVDWRLNGSRSGRAEVAQALSARPENFAVRHFVSNLEVTGGDVFFLLMVIGYFTGDEETAPYSLGTKETHGPIIGDMQAQLVQTADGLKISQLTSDVVFKAIER